MRKIRWIAWASAAVALVLIILAGISLITGKELLGTSHAVNFFHAANSFLLAAIALFIASKQCCCDKCECKDDKK